MSFPWFRRFVEESNDALAEIDGHARVLFVNRHWRQLVGPSDDEPSEGYSLGTWPQMTAALLRAQSEEAAFQTAVPKRSLPLRASLIRLVPDSDPAKARLLLRIRPLQAGLAPTRDRFFTLIDQFPFAIGVHRDQRFLYVNAAAASYLGYEGTEELVGQPIVRIVAPDEIPIVRRRVAYMMRSGKPLPERETKLLRKDGSIVVADLRAFMIHDEDGLPSYVVVARDVTERRALEERMRQSERMQAIGRLAGGIAHDFNNVLAVVLTYAELLQDNPGADNVIASAGEIQRAAQRAAALVRQLLTFSRGHRVEQRIVPINEVISGLSAFLQRSIGPKVVLRTELDGRLPAIRAGSSHLEQVLVNLALNARDAMPNGGDLLIRTRAIELGDPDLTGATVMGLDPGPYVVIEVADGGAGMNPGVASRAFEPFFTTKSPGKGTGLGLSTVYGIVSQAGGSCEIDSVVGGGTTVRLYWPASDELAGELDESDEPPELPPGTRVLLVEDDEAVRILVARLLESRGLEVLTANDGRGALTLQEQLQIRGDPPPEVLLSDVVMPQQSGPELARRLRTRQPGLPVVFMSGYADDNLDSEGLVGDSDWFVQKPFATRELLHALASALAGRRPPVS